MRNPQTPIRKVAKCWHISPRLLVVNNLWVRRTLIFVAFGLALNLATDLPNASATSLASSESSTPWTAVNESVLATIDSGGKLKGTPVQTTTASASAKASLTVEVPVSSAIKRPKAGTKPGVLDGSAHFKFESAGSTSQSAISNFTKELPLKVTPKYRYNGNLVEPSELSTLIGKSGELSVTYSVANISSETTTVEFSGFDGSSQSHTITQPIPLSVAVAVSLPEDATDVKAPNGGLASSAGGVSASWVLALAPPLGNATQSVTYSAHFESIEVPSASVSAAIISPSTTTSTELPNLPAEATAAAASKSQQDLGNSFNDASTSLQQVQAALTSLTTAQGSSGDSLSVGASDTQTGKIESALNSLSGQLSGDATSARTTLGSSVANLNVSLVDLGGQLDGQDLQSLSVLSDATAVSSLAATLVENVDLVAQLVANQVDDANALQVLVTQSIADLNDISDHSDPAWIQVSNDLAAALAKATAIQAAASELGQKLAALQDLAQQLQSNAASIEAKLQTLTQTAGSITSALQQQGAEVATSLSAQLAEIPNQIQSAGEQTAAIRLQLENLLSGKGAGGASGSKGSNADVAAKQQELQSTLQSQLGSAQQKLSQANADYAQILALQKIGMEHALPGGNAIGAINQSGAYVLHIAGS
jgi:hypothetical protein